jgi:hypothetical protein
MAIKDPTAALFRPQSGSNVLMVGQDEEAALAIQSMAIIGLAVQYPPRGPSAAASAPDAPAKSDETRFYVLDGTSVDSPHAGALARLGGVVPHHLCHGGWRDLPAIINEVAAEVSRRQEDSSRSSAAWYLVIYGLQRFRDLRPQEDDYGFTRRGDDQPPSPPKQFGTILREGPNVGVHTLVWCDSLSNLNRSLERQSLREFEMRVLFQMSAADSSNLIDSPLAARLGLHRALFYSEDRGHPEKFRPYSLPTDPWLGWVKEQIDRKTPVTSVEASGT